MKKIFFLAGALALSATCFAQSSVTIKKGKATMDEALYLELQAKAKAFDSLNTVQLNNFLDSASYAIGRDLYHSWIQQKLDINSAVAGKALIDMTKGVSQMDEKVDRALLQRFQSGFEERQKAKVADNIKQGKDFLAKNANSKQVHTTESGLQYRVVKQGNGKRPSINDQVKVHYTGTLIDGTKFDSSVDRGTPMTFPVGAVIPGWVEGLQLMDEGSKYILFIPYNLAYGEETVGTIPPGSTLVFEVELIEILPSK